MTLRDPTTERVVSDNWAVEFTGRAQPDVVVNLHPRTAAATAFKPPRDFGYSPSEICALAT
jgi:hypothetical protein